MKREYAILHYILPREFSEMLGWQRGKVPKSQTPKIDEQSRGWKMGLYTEGELKSLRFQQLEWKFAEVLKLGWYKVIVIILDSPPDNFWPLDEVSNKYEGTTTNQMNKFIPENSYQIIGIYPKPMKVS